MFFLTHIVQLVSWYGFALSIVSVAGLVIGTFELAFNRLYGQVIFRMILHVMCIPLSVYLSNLNTVTQTSTTVSRQSVSVLSIALLTVGCIGLSIAITELGLVPATSALIDRMLIYVLCIAVAIQFLPLVHAEAIKID